MKARSLLTLGVAALGLLVGPASGATQDAGHEPASKPQLMVLGSVHFANPGNDALNLDVEDVLEPERQAELELLVQRLAEFQPTHIAVEWDIGNQAALDELYAAWLDGERDDRSELSQIAFRLAERLGLERLDAVDWKGLPPGDPSAYDFSEWASENQRGEEFEAALAPAAARQAEFQNDMPCLTVSGWLAWANSPEGQRTNTLTYYRVARIGDASANPGAQWVAGSWHMRNLTIWSHLADLAETPEDRVLLLIGSGHKPLIEHFARDSESFEVLDPLEWLPEAHRRPCDG